MKKFLALLAVANLACQEGVPPAPAAPSTTEPVTEEVVPVSDERVIWSLPFVAPLTELSISMEHDAEVLAVTTMPGGVRVNISTRPVLESVNMRTFVLLEKLQEIPPGARFVDDSEIDGVPVFMFETSPTLGDPNAH